MKFPCWGGEGGAGGSVRSCFGRCIGDPRAAEAHGETWVVERCCRLPQPAYRDFSANAACDVGGIGCTTTSGCYQGHGGRGTRRPGPLVVRRPTHREEQKAAQPPRLPFRSIAPPPLHGRWAPLRLSEARGVPWASDSAASCASARDPPHPRIEQAPRGGGAGSAPAHHADILSWCSSESMPRGGELLRFAFSGRGLAREVAPLLHGAPSCATPNPPRLPRAMHFGLAAPREPRIQRPRRLQEVRPPRPPR